MGQVAKVMLGIMLCGTVGCITSPAPTGPWVRPVPTITLPPVTENPVRPGLDVLPMRSAEVAAVEEHAVRVPEVVAREMLRRRPLAMGYPADARSRNLKGTVRFRLVIGQDGSVEGLTVTRASDPVFVRTATAAVQSWLYKPYELNGQAVAMDTMAQVEFLPPDQRAGQMPSRSGSTSGINGH